MRLLLCEMRKIWRPGLIVVIVALGLAYWVTVASFDLRYLNNGPYFQADAALAEGWLEEFGLTMEPEERAQLDARLEREIAAFDEQVADLPEAVEAGIDGYAAYRAALSERPPEGDLPRDADLARVLASKTNYPTIQQLELFMESYDMTEEAAAARAAEASDVADAPWSGGLVGPRAAAVDQRMLAAHEGGERGFLPHGMLERVMSYAGHLASWTVLSVILLLIPVMTRDRLHGTCVIQRTSRAGRESVRAQIAAGMSSAALLALANVVAWGVPLALSGTLALASCPLLNYANSFYVPWLSVTYGQYLLILAVLTVAWGLVAAAGALFLSQLSDNYVSALLKALPLFAVLGMVLAPWATEGALMIRDVVPGSSVLMPCGMEVAVLVVLLAVGAVLLARLARSWEAPAREEW
ncbi:MULTISPECIES: hypothetical protein [unclassified Adlercreutzia]|uniref:hypothetical protein n=1 Tax=unclassified Adlercreutzia TaxID=2636013 RepID=UPI0013EA21A0|nr:MULTISPECIES: hypothetical protein [unclassified Adlercreutzia]